MSVPCTPLQFFKTQFAFHYVSKKSHWHTLGMSGDILRKPAWVKPHEGPTQKVGFLVMKRGPNVSKLKIIASILKSQNSASLPPFIFNTPQLNHALVGKFPHIWDALQPRKELRKPPVAAVRRARAVGGRLGVLPEGASRESLLAAVTHGDFMVIS